MAVSLRVAGRATHLVAETLLGHNLEAGGGCIQAMTSERLDNPKFLGAANWQTGIAPGWQPMGNNMGHVRYELTPGMSLSGYESQLIHNFGQEPVGILQTGRGLRKGETLEVELWAKAWHQPVTLQLEIAPLPSRQPCYDSKTVVVDAAYWKPYRVTLTSPCDDDQAVFKCLLPGEGVLWIDQIHLRPAGEGQLCQELIDRIGTLHMPVLRFPGGCATTNYHWRHGTGPAHLRPLLPDPVFKTNACYEFGTDEYLELCLSQKIRPHLTINIGSGTPDEAAEWAAYCAAWFRKRGVQPPTAYFQAGNEQYGSWESSHMTGDMYVDALKEFVPPLRKAYPNSRIIALGQRNSDGLRPELVTPWLTQVLDHAADYFDVLTLSRYKGQWNDASLDRQINVVESVPKVESDLRTMVEALRTRGLKQTVALTEWNFWLHASHWDGKGFQEPDDAQHGLFVAGMLNMFARLGADMELANFYHLVHAMGVFGRRGAGVETRSTADIFQLYRPAFPGRFLPLAVHSPALGECEPAVDALGLSNAKGTWLFFANRSPTENARVKLDGFTEGAAEVVMLRADDPLTPLRSAKAPRAGTTVLLPPLSLVRLRYPKTP